MDSQSEADRGFQRDFLAEAAKLALQLDPKSWDFGLPDHEVATASLNGPQQPWHYGKDAALAIQGTVLTDRVTPQGTESLCSIYQPPQQRSQSNKLLLPIRREATACESQDLATSSSGSDLEWEPGTPGSRGLRTGAEESRLRVREKSKAAQTAAQRRWRQKHKDKQDVQRKKLDRLEQRLAEVQLEKQALEAHADVLEKALMKVSIENSEVQTKASPLFIPSLGWTSFDPKGSIVLSAIFDAPRKLTAEEVARISLRDHARLWREYVVNMKECLEQADENGRMEPAPLKKLKTLLDERHGLICYVAAQNPHTLHLLTRCNMVSDPPEVNASGVNPQFYSNILRKIALTEEQGEALVEVRNMYLLGIGYYSAALSRMQSQLMALDPTPQESLRASSYVKWVEAARVLQETVEEIHLTHVLLHSQLYQGKHALTHIQAGKLLVESFPYMPDLMALVKELAKERDAPSAEELLRNGAMRYAEQQGAADVEAPSEPHVPVMDKISEMVNKINLNGSKSQHKQHDKLPADDKKQQSDALMA